MIGVTRREFAGGAAAAALTGPAMAQTQPTLARVIPSSGERLPAVGLGTAQVFDVNDETTQGKALAVLQALIAGGGALVDTSSVYGDGEVVLGEAITAGRLRGKLFIATKLESPNAAELKRSQARLRSEKFDLLQFHNVRDPQQSLAQFREWKGQGIARYIGITSTRHADFPAIEAVLAREKPISCRSITRSTIVKPKSASCRWRPKSKPPCSRRCRSAARGCFVRYGARKSPTGRAVSPKAGRSFFSSTSSPTPASPPSFRGPLIRRT